MISSLRKNILIFGVIILIAIAIIFFLKNKQIHLYGTTMGTTYSIVIINGDLFFDEEKIKYSIDSILVSYNDIFSTYIEDSEISNLNNYKSDDYISISSDFYQLLLQSNEISNFTNGKFDITVNPLISLWGFSGSDQSKFLIPTKEEIDSVLDFVGNDKYIYLPDKIKKSNPNVKFDFNAIAKGAAVDFIAKYLKDLGFNRFMVEIGGEITVSGLNKDDSLWKIGIVHPEKINNKLIKSINVSNISIATSGTYENFFYIDNKKYSHIIDPVTGYPVEHDLVSATVLAESASLADALATSFMVMGYDMSLEFANKLNGVECYLVSVSSKGEYKIGYSNNFLEY